MAKKEKNKIYLASPYGFTESTKVFMNKIIRILRKNGYKVKNPWDDVIDKDFLEIEKIKNEKEREKRYKILNAKLGSKNEESILNSDIVFAILDGVDVDSGTASEVGFAYANDIIIFGYRGDFRQSGENEGAIVNLQLQYWIEKSGGKIFREYNELKNFFKMGNKLNKRWKKN